MISKICISSIGWSDSRSASHKFLKKKFTESTSWKELKFNENEIITDFLGENINLVNLMNELFGVNIAVNLLLDQIKTPRHCFTFMI